MQYQDLSITLRSSQDDSVKLTGQQCKNILLYLLGIYIGQNVYAYAFGTSATRLWAGLLLVTSIMSCLFPALFAIAGKIISYFSNKSEKI